MCICLSRASEAGLTNLSPLHFEVIKTVINQKKYKNSAQERATKNGGGLASMQTGSVTYTSCLCLLYVCSLFDFAVLSHN